MDLFDILALLLVLSALFGYLNHRLLRLPHTIGLLVIALAASLSLIMANHLIPGFTVDNAVERALTSIDFHDVVMEGMLSFLLFAGAVHVDFSELAARRWAIGLLATVGVMISTLLIATAVWYLAALAGHPIPFIWAMVFGALISPTDPVAVLGILKEVNVPPELEAKIAGESLFNDGVGVVAFTIILAIAVGSGAAGEDAASPLHIAELFALEVGGGVLLGMAAGYLTYLLMRSIDEHNLEVLITLALVTGVYSLSLHLHLSGPLAVVVAGLFIGNHGARFAMSERTRTHVFQFWELTDEILNSVLFLLIGLEVLIVAATAQYYGTALAAIPIMLAGRFIAVATPITFLKQFQDFDRGTVRILTWGGLRGGISVALALSLPDNEHKPAILTMTYAVVVFSIIVQGLTMKNVVSRLIRDERSGAESS